MHKLGQAIGAASRDFGAGDHVHTRNLVLRAKGGARGSRLAEPGGGFAGSNATLDGHVRADGPVRLPGALALKGQRQAAEGGLALHPGLLEALEPYAARWNISRPAKVGP